MNDSVKKRPVHITCFSDVLCVWAYVAERRLVEVREQFGASVLIDYRYISIFGDTQAKFTEGWKDRGGFKGYADHVSEAIAGFDHIELNADAWRQVRPASSGPAHLLLKAVQLACPGKANENVERLAWALRLAFFAHARDIARTDVQMEIVDELALPREAIETALNDGAAFAALSRDADEQQLHRIEGSPTYLLNHGRQKLFGNVGFRIIEANIHELLHEPSAAQASWC